MNNQQPTSTVQKVIDLSKGTVIKPGPPKTVFNEGYYYKVFGTQEQAQKCNGVWDDADTAGVLTPVHGVAEVTDAGTRKWAFWSKSVTGTFFQFSKPGHAGQVIAWIGKQTSLIQLGRLEKEFAYVAAHIGDGQGFFQDSDGGNLWFIDVNLMGTTPNALDVVAAIQARILALTPAVPKVEPGKK